MIYVSNNRHIADIGLEVHDVTHLLTREIHLKLENNISRKKIIEPMHIKMS